MARLANPALAERRRHQIMDAAIACFRRRGFHQTTMAEICAEAGVSAGAIYHYFASKSEIISAIAEDAREGADAAFLRMAEQDGLVAALCQSASGFFHKLSEGDGALMADIIAESIRDETISATMRRADANSIRVTASAVRASQKRGETAADLDPELAAHTIMAAIEGIGLRRAFLGDASGNVADAQFRAFLERYLSLRS